MTLSQNPPQSELEFLKTLCISWNQIYIRMSHQIILDEKKEVISGKLFALDCQKTVWISKWKSLLDCLQKTEKKQAQ